MWMRCKNGFIYSRNTNPTVHVLEEKIRILEKAEAATSFATGMGAISNTLFALPGPGKRVVSIENIEHHTPGFPVDESAFIWGIKALCHLTTDYMTHH